ncbi:MAG: hypothetical protein LBN30_06160 [Oscillospiraceae bacterium]|nr:hypothetical protein [Oscillospiraceae bacterium]
MARDNANDEVAAGATIPKLGDYFDPTRFRIVREDGIFAGGGISEVGVVINMREKFARSLSFTSTSLRVIYGFAQLSDKLRELNKARYVSDGILKKVTMNDCLDKFVVVFELGEELDSSIDATPDEVRQLLESCRRPPDAQ